MKRFSHLIEALDSAAPLARKTAALVDYLIEAPDDDRLWAIALVSGRRPRRVTTLRDLQAWAAVAADLPPWLLEASLPVVGDRAETIALILPPPRTPDMQPLSHWAVVLTQLGHKGADARRSVVCAAWEGLDPAARVVFNKLATGGFRSHCPTPMLTDALAQATGADPATLAHQLAGDWHPTRTSFAALIRPNDPAIALSQPFPFQQPARLTDPVEILGAPADWLAEWHWDGLPCQLVLRGGCLSLWLPDNALITHHFPEFMPVADALPDGTVIAATILAGADLPPLPRAVLDNLIGRKAPTKRHLSEAPARLIAHDLLEADGQDLRTLPFDTRRARLQAILAGVTADLPLTLSHGFVSEDWPALTLRHAGARAVGALGLILTRRESAYGPDGARHWPADLMSVDAVLVYAEGQAAGSAPEFTFALRDPASDDWLPIAKTRAGLTGPEAEALATWARKNTAERFGPVRRVPPERVFRIAFDAVQPSPRRKSGLTLLGARILCALPDCPASEADTIATLRALIPPSG